MRMTRTLRGVGAPPKAYATAFMVSFIEWACVEALKPYLDEGEDSIGTRVNVTHIAQTPIGLDVTANVEMVSQDGQTLCFKVSCNDEFDVIGEGYHERAIVGREPPQELSSEPRREQHEREEPRIIELRTA